MYKIDDILAEKNYSKCPLKKRPVNYQFNSEDKGAGTAEAVASLCKIEKKTVLKSEQEKRYCSEEPENLSLKKETWNGETTISCSSTVKDEMLINVSNDSCEDEGVDVDHIDDEDEDDEMIDCVDIEEDDNGDAGNTTQAAALAAAAAVAAASAAVVVPQPTYPNYGIQPWNFHMSPYTAEFYRTINNPHLTQQISPLGSELLSPSSPSESLSSLSPPPHYLHGRPSSVSPPMRSDIIHCPIGLRQLPQPKQPQPQQQHQHQHQHRFMPFPTIPTYHVPHQTNAYPFSYHHHHAPISPAYSDSSYFSLRSMTPESNCSSVPEDLSLKHNALQKLTPVHISPRSEHSSNNVDMVSSSNNMINGTASNGSTDRTMPNSISGNSKKEKSVLPRYQCPDCQKSYSTFSGLTKHQQFHCPSAEGNQVKKSFSCKDCDKTYYSLGALKMHIRTHTLPCKCTTCGKAFSRPWLLQGHIRTHTGEKPFSCQHCQRAFADRSNLRAHLQTHSDIKKYSCTNCSKTFSRMSLLTKHSEGGCHGGTGQVSSSSMGGSSSTNSSTSSNNSSNSNTTSNQQILNSCSSTAATEMNMIGSNSNFNLISNP